MEKPNLASVSDIDTAMRVRSTTIEQILKLLELLERPFVETRRTARDIKAGIAMLREEIRIIDTSVEAALDTLCNEGWPEPSLQEGIYDDDAPRSIPRLMAGDHPLLG